jgi:hypothetical protein
VEEQDLAFADFGSDTSGSERLYPAPGPKPGIEDENAAEASARRRFGILERETGLEPATLSLGNRKGSKK